MADALDLAKKIIRRSKLDVTLTELATRDDLGLKFVMIAEE